MKKSIAIICFFLCLSSIFAIQKNISVQISNEVYRVIDSAEIKGIIPTQPEVKPYTLGRVKDILEEIKSSDSISDKDKEYIDTISESLDRRYGGEKASNIQDILLNGYYTGLGNEFFDIAVGGRFSNQNTIGINNGAKDFRNKITAYFSGDISQSISFYIDFAILIDRLDHNAFLTTDFTTECNGWYMGFGNGGLRTQTSPFKSFEEGLAMNPEIGASAFNDTLFFRFGSIKREWGPGINNLALSGSARSFEALELSFSPSSKFSFSVAAGSLGKGFLSMDGQADSIGNVDLRDCTYDNNFSIQRIEVSPIDGLILSIYESVIYRKRFELAYLNPLSIYMFAQNYIGDFDNVLAGIDLSYILKDIGKVYFALAIDECERINPKTFFTWARNIIALQGGLNVPVSLGMFGVLTLQATYIPPFFGTHYAFSSDNQPFYNGEVKIDYINKGQPLSYPLYPDSFEILASFKSNINPNTSLDIVIKDQMRSAQYAIDETYGTTMHDNFNYSVSNEYVPKEFFSYVWKNVFDFELNGKYSFDSFPLTLKAGIQCIIESSKSFSVSEEAKNNGYNTGNHTMITSSWGKPDIRYVINLGFNIYY